MAVKPIIDIEVNDAEFRRFYDLFEAYSAELDEMPEAWRTLGAAMGESTKGLEGGALTAREALAVAAAQAGIISEALRDATKAANGLDKSVDKGSKGMDRLRKSAEGVGKAIATVSGWILKIGAIGGLGTIFSGFGFGELAGSAFRRYRTASSLGISTGALASFQVNAQQFLTTSALEAAANAQNDISKAGYLAALGIRYNVARSLSATDLAFEELKAARAAYVKNPALALQSPAIQSYISLGGSISDVRNAANVPLSQLLSAQNRTRADAGMLGFSAQTAQAWTNLKITLDKAGVAIETDLINKLGPLTPELTKLTEGIIDAVAQFIGGKGFDEVIKDVKHGIGALATFVEKTDWKKIGDTVGLVFAEIDAVAKKLSWLVPKQNKKDDGTKTGFTLNPMKNIHDIVSGAWWNSPENQATIKALKLGASWVANNAGKPMAWLMNATGAVPGDFVKNNPLDEKMIRNGRLFWAQFPTTDAGIRANAKLLANYPKNWGADTLAKIISVWAPSSDGNNPNSYTANVEKWSGVPRNLPIAKWTKAQFAAVIAAMSREEGTDQVSIRQVIKALYGSELPSEASKAHTSRHQTVRVMQRDKRRVRPPVHVSVSNSTSARVAVSINAVAAS